MDKTSARDRWWTTEGRTRGIEITNLLAQGQTSRRDLLRHTSITEEGFVDLQGLTFGPNIWMKDASLREIDFSFGDLSLILERCVIEGMLFREVSFQKWNERRCQFTDVDFSGSTFREAAIGIQCSTYRRVSFRKVQFLGPSFYCPQFIE